jgi:hypothetical protein
LVSAFLSITGIFGSLPAWVCAKRLTAEKKRKATISRVFMAFLEVDSVKHESENEESMKLGL